MKTMTCEELGGACSEKFTAETFDDMGELAKNHAMEMFQKQDAGHLEAMGKMQELMQDESKLQAWMKEKEDLFNSKPEDV